VMNNAAPALGHAIVPAPAEADTFTAAYGRSWSLECEQVVLGAVLLKPALFEAVSNIVQPDDFYEAMHGEIFAAMDAVIASGRPLSFLMVRAAIPDRPFGEITTGQYLARIVSNAAVLDHGVEYARIIRDLSLRRRMISMCADAITAAGALSQADQTPKLASELVAALDDVASAGYAQTARRVSIGEAMASAVRNAWAAKDGTRLTGVPTGLVDLDDKLGGLKRGEGTVLAGRPSMGKTALALDIALNVARTGRGVFYYSAEMSAEALGNRAAASVMFDDGAVSYFAMDKGRATADELRRAEDAAALVRSWPLLIEQQPQLSVSQIAARAGRVKLQFEAQGIELALIVVDHMGLVASSNRYKGNRVQEMGEISAGFHALAKQLGCHCLMLSQLNRGVESREDKRPMMSDLRESGDIEQNADCVLSVFRPAYYLERKERSSQEEIEYEACLNDLDVGVLKQRNGSTGTVKLFVDIASNAVRGRHA
jgi:replicative DNA helicase